MSRLPAADRWKPHVLVVDDENDIRVAVSRYLESRGFQVSAAETGMMACQEWHRGMRPDVIITDYKMPGMNGIEVVEWFRAKGSHAGAVMISGNVGEIPPTVFRNITVLPKPFRVSDLLQAVQNLQGGSLTAMPNL